MPSTLRILYVDDEPDLLDIGKMFLEESGDFFVITVGSASAALEILKTEQFDAVISDYQMPGTDGIQFLVEVRARFGRIPFILFTGRGREEIVVQAIKNGVDFYLQKGGELEAQFAELAHKIRMAVDRRIFDTALKESEEKYRRIVETAQEGIWALDNQFVTTYVNERMAEMLGYTAEDMIGKKFQSFIHVEDLADHQLRIQERMQGHPGSYGLRFMTKEGIIRTFHISATPVIGGGDSFLGTFAMLTDITEREKANERLKESEKFNKEIIYNAKEGIVFYDRNYDYLVWNPFMESITGITASEALGKNAFDIFPHLKQQKVDILLKRALDGETVQSPDTLYLIPHTKKRGWVSGIYSPHFNSQGDIIGVIGIIRDITERKQAEEALVIAQEKYTKAFLASPDAIIITDLETGTFIEVNEATSKISGYSREELIGKSSLELNLWPGKEERDSLVNQVRSNGRVEGSEIRLLHKNGIQFYTSVSADIITIGDRRCLLSIIRDIADRKQKEEALRESENKFRVIFDTINDGIEIHEIEPDGKPGKFIEVNEVACRMYQCSREELMGRGPLDFVTAYHSKPLDEIVMEQSMTGHAMFETEHKRKDGTIIPVEINTHKVGLRGKQVMVSVVRDISDRIKAESELRESEEKFRSLVGYALEAILILDLQGTILFANNAATRLVEAEDSGELIGRNVIEFIAPESREGVIRDFIEVSQGHDAYLTDYHVISLKGKKIHVESIGKVFSYGGKTVDFISLRDITERK